MTLDTTTPTTMFIRMKVVKNVKDIIRIGAMMGLADEDVQTDAKPSSLI